MCMGIRAPRPQIQFKHALSWSTQMLKSHTLNYARIEFTSLKARYWTRASATYHGDLKLAWWPKVARVADSEIQNSLPSTSSWIDHYTPQLLNLEHTEQTSHSIKLCNRNSSAQILCSNKQASTMQRGGTFHRPWRSCDGVRTSSPILTRPSAAWRGGYAGTPRGASTACRPARRPPWGEAPDPGMSEAAEPLTG